MPDTRFIKPERINLKSDPIFNERWVQDRVAEDPSILGLGDLVLKDRERAQPKAGRLDLLLQDTESNRRYEVEIQLGSVDESHIIRTIEYWDIERKRFPQYDHCAVIVAEDITSRFLNIISLFNGAIPLIAIQMKALRIGEGVALDFTTVLGERTLGLEEDDEEAATTDRAYWESRSSKETLGLVDELLTMIHQFGCKAELKYNKFYIGLVVDGQSDLFVLFRAKRQHIRMEAKLAQSDKAQMLFDKAELDILGHSYGRYRIRLTKDDLKKNKEAIGQVMKMAYDQSRES